MGLNSIIETLKESVTKIDPDISDDQVSQNLTQTFSDIGIDSLDSVAILLMTLRKLGLKEDLRLFSKKDPLIKIIEKMDDESKKSNH